MHTWAGVCACAPRVLGPTHAGSRGRVSSDTGRRSSPSGRMAQSWQTNRQHTHSPDTQTDPTHLHTHRHTIVITMINECLLINECQRLTTRCRILTLSSIYGQWVHSLKNSPRPQYPVAVAGLVYNYAQIFRSKFMQTFNWLSIFQHRRPPQDSWCNFIFRPCICITKG